MTADHLLKFYKYLEKKKDYSTIEEARNSLKLDITTIKRILNKLNSNGKVEILGGSGGIIFKLKTEAKKE